MKKTTVMAAALLSSATAMASLKVSVRSDYVNGGEYTNTSNTKVGSTSLLVPNLAEIDFGSKISDAEIKGRLNLREYDVVSNTPVMTPDKFVHYIYIVKPLGDFTVSAGKLVTNSGGAEAVRVIAADTYLISLANGGIKAGNGMAVSANPATGADYSALATPGNASGVAAAYTMGDHKVEVQVQNATNSNTATGNKRRHNIGVNYTGSFASKMVAVNLGYIAGHSDTSSSENNETYLNGGVALNMGSVGVELDYLSNKTISTATGAKANSVTSIVAEARYKLGAITPILKVESSENQLSEDAATAGSFKRTGYAVAAEFVPKEGDNFRYHVAYAGVSDKYGQAGLANDTVKYNQIIVGFKYTGDILK